MSEEYLHALSWEAATERLESAGSIPEKEAELKTEALSSSYAGFEITLPPLIEDVEDRKLVADGIRRSRSRYRRFRSRLSEEISQSSGECFHTFNMGTLSFVEIVCLTVHVRFYFSSSQSSQAESSKRT